MIVNTSTFSIFGLLFCRIIPLIAAFYRLLRRIARQFDRLNGIDMKRFCLFISSDLKLPQTQFMLPKVLYLLDFPTLNCILATLTREKKFWIEAVMCSYDTYPSDFQLHFWSSNETSIQKFIFDLFPVHCVIWAQKVQLSEFYPSKECILQFHRENTGTVTNGDSIDFNLGIIFVSVDQIFIRINSGCSFCNMMAYYISSF